MDVLNLEILEQEKTKNMTQSIPKQGMKYWTNPNQIQNADVVEKYAFQSNALQIIENFIHYFANWMSE